ncbi:type II secretion system protein [Candidatus Gracilibacteria bacterium]|nr:type II secretion system protein [Candidatus Gracilibacteria bacterium]
MKNKKSAFSIIESVVVIAILALGIIGVFGFFSRSRDFLDGVSAKIEAIEIAREGIEAVENIRNTNWLRFPGNKKFCWNVLNYNSSCILDNDQNTNAEKIKEGANYIVNNVEGVWMLEEKDGSGNFSNPEYRERFIVGKDNNGKYCQKLTPDCKKIPLNYTRKIQIKESDMQEMSVKVVVEWQDQSSSKPRKVEIDNLLKNYKK